MQEPKFVKTFEEVYCPHCRNPIIVGAQAMMSTIVSTNTPDQIRDIKQQIIKRLNEITFKSPEKRKQIETWLLDEETLIDRSDIESLIKQISIEQLGKDEDGTAQKDTT